jgi:hypothetical protein
VSWRGEMLILMFSSGRPGEAALPLRGLSQHLLQEPFAHRDDEAGLLEQRDELLRADHATRRILPAQQRLDADQASGPQRHDRLVVDRELRLLQRVLEAAIGVGRRQHVPRGLVVEHDGTHARLLGLVQGDVGVLEHVGVALRVLRAHSGPDVCVEAERATVALDGLGDRAEEPRGDGLGRLGGRHVGAEHHEGVAAVADDHVDLAQRGGHAPHHVDQHLVAHLVAEAGVDLSEAVEVHEQDGEAAAAAVRLLGEVLEAGAEEAPVRQRRERIVGGEVLEHRL